MRYKASPETSCLSCDLGTFIADDEGYFLLEGDSQGPAAFAAQGIALTPHPEDLASAEAVRLASEEFARIEAEEAALAVQMAENDEKQRIFDAAVERRVAERLAETQKTGKKAAPPKGE